MINYKSYKIKYNNNLYTITKKINKDFDIPIELVNNNFIPKNIKNLIENTFTTYNNKLTLHTNPNRTYEKINYTINDFDLIFTYP